MDMVQWAEDSRDSHCSAHPLLRRAAGAPHTRGYSSTDKSIRLSTGEVRVRIPLVSLELTYMWNSDRRREAPEGGAINLVSLLRARGAALTSRRRCEVLVTALAVVAQRIESTSLRTRGSGVRISPTAPA